MAATATSARSTCCAPSCVPRRGASAAPSSARGSTPTASPLRSSLTRMAKKGTKRKVASGDVATNRQASYRFELLDRLEAGMVLEGTEVKALREGGAQLKDAYVSVRDGELWLHHLHIPPYAPASRDNHETERDRKLLAHRHEIDRLVGRTQERGLTLVPTRIYFRDGRAKAEVALARGKNRFDKRESIRDREQRRDMDRALREANR